MPTGVILCITRVLGVEQKIALIIDETMGIACKVIKDIEIIIIISEKIVIEVKIMTGTGVGHYIHRSELGETTEVQAMVGLGQDQQILQTEIGLDVLSVKSMIILLGSVLLNEKIGRQNKYNRCLA